MLFMHHQDEVPATVDPKELRDSATFLHLVEAVQHCMEAGAIRQADPFAVAVGLWVLVHGITSLRISIPASPGRTAPSAWSSGSSTTISRACCRGTDGPISQDSPTSESLPAVGGSATMLPTPLR